MHGKIGIQINSTVYINIFSGNPICTFFSEPFVLVQFSLLSFSIELPTLFSCSGMTASDIFQQPIIKHEFRDKVHMFTDICDIHLRCRNVYICQRISPEARSDGEKQHVFCELRSPE